MAQEKSWYDDPAVQKVKNKVAEKTTDFVMQGSTTERNDYNYMIGKFRVLEEIEDEIKEILDKGEKSD